MSKRHEFWLVIALIVVCVPLMMGAMCKSPESDSTTEKSIDEVAEEAMEARAVPIYPGAVGDTSEEGMAKAASVGGTMYVTTDSWEKVIAFYEKELSGKDGFSRQGSSRFTYKNAFGETVEIFVMPAGPDGGSTDILISAKQG